MIQSLFLIFAVAAGSLLLVRMFLSTSPASLARGLRYGLGASLLAAAVGLAAFRQFAFALPLAATGLAILSRSGFFRSARPSRGGKSNVRSPGLDMTLDHETGEMDGRVLAGGFEGRSLSALKLPELLRLAKEFSSDPESLRLLEGYLDRAHAGWRDDVEQHGDRQRRAAAGAVRMSAQEAYEILGLSPDASDADVREAHRRLIKQVHPDRGGSAALAAKINEAKERLVGRH